MAVVTASDRIHLVIAESRWDRTPDQEGPDQTIATDTDLSPSAGNGVNDAHVEPAAIVGKDVNGFVTLWNKAAETMFGYAINEIIGQPITRIIPWDRIDVEALILERVYDSGKQVHFATKRQRKDGRIIFVSLTASPITDNDGRIIGVSQTLTEAQPVGAHRERNSSALRPVAETDPYAVMVFDKQGIIRTFGAAAVRMFGYNFAR